MRGGEQFDVLDDVMEDKRVAVNNLGDGPIPDGDIINDSPDEASRIDATKLMLETASQVLYKPNEVIDELNSVETQKRQHSLSKLASLVTGQQLLGEGEEHAIADDILSHPSYPQFKEQYDNDNPRSRTGATTKGHDANTAMAFMHDIIAAPQQHGAIYETPQIKDAQDILENARSSSSQLLPVGTKRDWQQTQTTTEYYPRLQVEENKTYYQDSLQSEQQEAQAATATTPRSPLTDISSLYEPIDLNRLEDIQAKLDYLYPKKYDSHQYNGINDFLAHYKEQHARTEQLLQGRDVDYGENALREHVEYLKLAQHNFDAIAEFVDAMADVPDDAGGQYRQQFIEPFSDLADLYIAKDKLNDYRKKYSSLIKDDDLRYVQDAELAINQQMEYAINRLKPSVQKLLPQRGFSSFDEFKDLFMNVLRKNVGELSARLDNSTQQETQVQVEGGDVQHYALPSAGDINYITSGIDNLHISNVIDLHNQSHSLMDEQLTDKLPPALAMYRTDAQDINPTHIVDAKLAGEMPSQLDQQANGIHANYFSVRDQDPIDVATAQQLQREARKSIRDQQEQSSKQAIEDQEQIAELGKVSVTQAEQIMKKALATDKFKTKQEREEFKDASKVLIAQALSAMKQTLKDYDKRLDFARRQAEAEKELAIKQMEEGLDVDAPTSRRKSQIKEATGSVDVEMVQEEEQKNDGAVQPGVQPGPRARAPPSITKTAKQLQEELNARSDLFAKELLKLDKNEQEHLAALEKAKDEAVDAIQRDLNESLDKLIQQSKEHGDIQMRNFSDSTSQQIDEMQDELLKKAGEVLLKRATQDKKEIEQKYEKAVDTSMRVQEQRIRSLQHMRDAEVADRTAVFQMQAAEETRADIYERDAARAAEKERVRQERLTAEAMKERVRLEERKADLEAMTARQKQKHQEAQMKYITDITEAKINRLDRNRAHREDFMLRQRQQATSESLDKQKIALQAKQVDQQAAVHQDDLQLRKQEFDARTAQEKAKLSLQTKQLNQQMDVHQDDMQLRKQEFEARTEQEKERIALAKLGQEQKKELATLVQEGLKEQNQVANKLLQDKFEFEKQKWENQQQSERDRDARMKEERQAESLVQYERSQELKKLEAQLNTTEKKDLQKILLDHQREQAKLEAEQRARQHTDTLEQTYRLKMKELDQQYELSYADKNAQIERMQLAEEYKRQEMQRQLQFELQKKRQNDAYEREKAIRDAVDTYFKGQSQYDAADLLTYRAQADEFLNSRGAAVNRPPPSGNDEKENIVADMIQKGVHRDQWWGHAGVDKHKNSSLYNIESQLTNVQTIQSAANRARLIDKLDKFSITQSDAKKSFDLVLGDKITFEQIYGKIFRDIHAIDPTTADENHSYGHPVDNSTKQANVMAYLKDYAVGPLSRAIASINKDQLVDPYTALEMKTTMAAIDELQQGGYLTSEDAMHQAGALKHAIGDALQATLTHNGNVTEILTDIANQHRAELTDLNVTEERKRERENIKEKIEAQIKGKLHEMGLLEQKKSNPFMDGSKASDRAKYLHERINSTFGANATGGGASVSGFLGNDISAGQSLVAIATSSKKISPQDAELLKQVVIDKKTGEAKKYDAKGNVVPLTDEEKDTLSKIIIELCLYIYAKHVKGATASQIDAFRKKIKAHAAHLRGADAGSAGALMPLLKIANTVANKLAEGRIDAHGIKKYINTLADEPVTEADDDDDDDDNDDDERERSQRKKRQKT